MSGRRTYWGVDRTVFSVRSGLCNTNQTVLYRCKTFRTRSVRSRFVLGTLTPGAHRRSSARRSLWARALGILLRSFSCQPPTTTAEYGGTVFHTQGVPLCLSVYYIRKVKRPSRWLISAITIIIIINNNNR